MKGIEKKLEGKSCVDGHDIIRPMHINQVPEDKTVTYARFCCDHRPQKEEQYRCRITAGGDRLQHGNAETSVEVSGMETTKIHINSTISTPGARYATGDISNMYTNS